MRVRQPRWRARARRGKKLRRALLVVAVVMFSLPLVWTLLASFGMRPQISTLPPQWSLPPTTRSYSEIGVAEGGFWGDLLSSVGISTAATALGTAVAFLAAYSLSRARTRNKDRLAQVFLVLASIPVMAFVIPLDGTIRLLRLHDTFAGVFLAQAAVFAPLAVYVFYGQLREIPLDYEEAARLDGAGLLQTLARVIIPMNAAGCAATAIVLFTLNWNSFLIPMVVTTYRVRTIPLALSDFFVSDRELEWPTAAAALVVSLAPLVVLVSVAHRTLQRFFLGARQTGN
jgi:ABC-type glycerol-3-phosphate transport system permease component